MTSGVEGRAGVAMEMTTETLTEIGDHTSLMIALPELDDIIGGYRGRYTQGGWREPAHITLLDPFVAPAAVTPAVLRRVEEVAATFPAFDFRVTGLAAFPWGSLYLTPEPADPFVGLITHLMAAFPETNPYWNRYGGEIVPHVTVADPALADRPHLFEEIEAAVAPQLPVRCWVRETVLLWIRPFAASWEVLGRVPLPAPRRMPGTP